MDLLFSSAKFQDGWMNNSFLFCNYGNLLSKLKGLPHTHGVFASASAALGLQARLKAIWEAEQLLPNFHKQA